jgi:signal transduction histidine kinase
MKKKHQTLTDVGKVHAALVELLIPVDLESVYQEVVDQAVRLASAQYGTIFLVNQKDSKFVRAYSTVPKNQQFSPRPQGNTAWVYHHSRFRIVSRKDLLANHPEVDPDIHSVILIPLFFQKEKLGVLSLQTNLTMPFNKKHKESLRLFGNIASLAIRNAQLHTQKQKALETRDLFMSAASHEFKTPLSSIRAYAQLIQQKLVKGKVIPEKAINAIIRNADRLTDMINSLFMASQVSAGTFNSYKEDFDLYLLTKESIDDLQIASTRNLQFKSNKKNIPFRGDKHQWVSLVMNLVRNAINYSPVNTPVVISLHVNKAHITFQVSNEGKGISKSDIKHIFEKYFRSKQQKAGLGLGLFLCHQIVKAHHGTIKITSLPNIKTEVTVALPITP